LLGAPRDAKGAHCGTAQRSAERSTRAVTGPTSLLSLSIHHLLQADQANNELARAAIISSSSSRVLVLSCLYIALMAVDSSDEPTVRSAAVWYADGTLVIRAENTLFRVYRGILASQSDIFNDMLSVPQPLAVADTETFDGCVVVRVHDAAVDMERFLRTILDIRYVR
jgi:hypothetical protein